MAKKGKESPVQIVNICRENKVGRKENENKEKEKKSRKEKKEEIERKFLSRFQLPTSSLGIMRHIIQILFCFYYTLFWIYLYKIKFYVKKKEREKESHYTTDQAFFFFFFFFFFFE